MAWFTAPSGATCVAAYDAIGAASLADSYVNEANPGTFDAAPGVAPTWAYGTGWTFNGSTQYLTCGLPLNNTTSQSVIIRMSPTGSSKRGVLWDGSSSGDLIFLETDREFIRVDTLSTSLAYGLSNGAQVVALTNSGVAAGGGWAVYVNGTNVNAGNGRAGTFNAVSLQIGRAEGSAAAMRYFPGDVAAVAVYSGMLTSADVTAITTAMNALPSAGGSIVPIVVAAHGAYLGAGGML